MQKQRLLEKEFCANIIIGKDDISVVNVCIKILSNFDLILCIMFFPFDSII